MTTFSQARVRTPVLAALLLVLAAGVLVQASLAGLFVSDVADVERIHLYIGVALPVIAIVPTAIAWVGVAKRRVSSGFAAVVTALLVGLWVQEALGHMPFDVSTAVHVPLGVLLFGTAAALGIHALRPRRAGVDSGDGA